MSAKTAKKSESIAVRSSRRIRGTSTNYALEFLVDHSVREVDSTHLCAALEDPR
jgi:hypothetical protein